jgi:hypothetical protein
MTGSFDERDHGLPELYIQIGPTPALVYCIPIEYTAVDSSEYYRSALLPNLHNHNNPSSLFIEIGSRNLRTTLTLLGLDFAVCSCSTYSSLLNFFLESENRHNNKGTRDHDAMHGGRIGQ